MAQVLEPVAPPRPILTLADLLVRFAHISPKRIRLNPAAGAATEADLLRCRAAKIGPLCELVDGVLVEKAVGQLERFLSNIIATILTNYVIAHNLGAVWGPDSMNRTQPGRVRSPDVSFWSWGRLPGNRLQDVPLADDSPDLVVEVLSDSNTAPEMAEKREEYFATGTKLVWEVDRQLRSICVYSNASGPPRVLRVGDAVDGGGVLPGFTLTLAELFGHMDRHG